MKLSGNWEGFYEYGQGYTLPHFGKRVKIVATISEANFSFTGTINEEQNEYSVPLEATIKGFIDDDFISFVKTYPKKPILKEFGKTEIIFENSKLEIEHEGFVDVENNSIYGNWYIKELITDEFGSFENIIQGIWILSKK